MNNQIIEQCLAIVAKIFEMDKDTEPIKVRAYDEMGIH